MKLFPAMWLTESLDPDRRRILRKAKKGSFPAALYAVALPEKDSELLTVYPGSFLTLPLESLSGLEIIGAAETRQAAIELAGGILARVLHETGKLNVRDYIRRAEEEMPL